MLCILFFTNKYVMWLLMEQILQAGSGSGSGFD